MSARLPTVGFYGKLPSHGDFVRRRVSDAFVSAWDEWLQECLAASRWALGQRWLEVYLTSPSWRFACAAGTCGPAPIAGIMVPSVDRVGRYFPLTLAAELPPSASIVRAATCGEPFFDRAERLVIETLAAEQVDFDRFDEQVCDLGRDLQVLDERSGVVLEGAAAAILDVGAQPAWQIPLGSSSELSAALEQVLSQRLSAVYDPLVLWWSEGSSIVPPSCLVSQGLPHRHSFAALLDGSWSEREWRSVAGRVHTAAVAAALPDREEILTRLASAAATHAGCVREINQDAFLERPDVGVWAVADGLGGHHHGEIASRMVCDALADFLPGAGFEETIDAMRQRIEDVNEHLVRAASRSHDAVGSGSTVVAMLARGERCAILWAGDSRLYRWRNGRLEQLTRDHSLAPVAGRQGDDCHAVTRAVGGESGLTLDLHRDVVRAGDRFLLCSDGLTRAVPEAEIRVWMEHESISAAVSGLINATLDAGAPDNVTVLIVEATGVDTTS